ncbi:membrane protein [Arthrobacter phage Gorpy]|nr:membrane protein [Arthrobacter phage Gorpy]
MWARVIGIALFAGPFLALAAALVIDISADWLAWSLWDGALVAGAMSASLIAGFMLIGYSTPRF